MAQESLEIIGTAHVSEKSVEKVRNTILEKNPDVVAVELDINRYTNLLNEEKGEETPKQEFQLKKLIRGNNLTLFLVSGFLSYMQRRIGDDVGVKPGSEMMAAVKAAEETGAKIALIDRDISITLNRALNKMSFVEKMKFVYGLIASFFTDDEDIEDIESITEGDALEEVMKYFQEMSPKAYDVLVNERDKYMARMLLDIPEENIVAVVGAGHKEGITKYINDPEKIPPLYDLLEVKKSRFSLSKVFFVLIPAIFLVAFVTIFAMAFINGINLQMSIYEYVLITSSLSFVGCILSGSKIPSALLALVLGPLSVLHVLPAVGFFSGAVEAKMRKVGMDDVLSIGECDSLRDFWKNDFFRVLLVVLGTNVGASIGFFLTIPNVLLPLVSKIFGWG